MARASTLWRVVAVSAAGITAVGWSPPYRRATDAGSVAATAPRNRLEPTMTTGLALRGRGRGRGPATGRTSRSTSSPDSQSLGLMDAVGRALITWPAAHIARADVRRSAAALHGLKSERLPRLSVEGAGTQFQEPMIVAPLHGFDPREPPDFDRLLVQGRVVAAYTVFDAGARGARIEGGQAAAHAAAAGAAATLAAVIERTVRAYLDVAAAREIAAANGARVDALAEERARTDRMLAAGSVPQVAVLRADAALARATAEHAAAVAELRRAEAELGRLVGARADSVAALSLEAVRLALGQDSPDRDALIADAAARSPAVDRARAQLAGADAVIAEARAAYWPAFVLNAGVNTFGSAAGDFATEWQAALHLTYPLFTGGARSAAVERAVAGRDAASAALSLARLDASSAIDAGLAGLAGARAQVNALESAVSQFAAVVDIEELSLNAGAGLQTEYLSVVSDLLDARAALTRARTAVITSRVALARTTGELDVDWLARNLEVQR